MDVKDILCKFLYEKNKDKESWFAGINALYSDTNENLDGSKISEITMDWIGKKSKILAANLELINNEYEKEEAQLELDAILSFTEIRNFHSWRRIVESINNSYENYLSKIESKELDYLIISESPMLNYNSGKYSCNYILGENEKVGSYRKVPYEAFGGKKSNPSSDDLISLFQTEKVGFFDLIPLPLPKIDTDLRRLWSLDENYRIDGMSRTMFFLKLAFENFQNKTNCRVTQNTKVILMMPPNTATGIISFYLENGSTGNTDLDNLSNRFLEQNSNVIIVKHSDLIGIPIRLHKQVVMNGSGGPDLKLFKHAMR